MLRGPRNLAGAAHVLRFQTTWFPIFISSATGTAAVNLNICNTHEYFCKYFDPYTPPLTSAVDWGKALTMAVTYLPRNDVGNAGIYAWPHFNDLSNLFEQWQLRGHRIEFDFLLPQSTTGPPKSFDWLHLDEVANPTVDGALIPNIYARQTVSTLGDTYFWSDQGRTPTQVFTNRVIRKEEILRRKHKVTRKLRRYLKFRTKFPRMVRRRWVDITSATTGAGNRDVHQFLTESPFKDQTQASYYDQPLYQPRAFYAKFDGVENFYPVTTSDDFVDPTHNYGLSMFWQRADLYAPSDGKYNLGGVIPGTGHDNPPPANCRIRFTTYMRAKKFY